MALDLNKLVEQHRHYLCCLAKAPEKKARILIRNAPLPTLTFLGDVAYNLQKGRLPLTPAQREWFHKHKKLLKQISDPYRYKAKDRRQTLRQRGGNLSVALSKLILSAVRCPAKDHVAEARQAEEAKE